MKWLFLFVVLLNAGFLSWHSFIQDQPDVKQESVYGPPVSEKVYLLSEEARGQDLDRSQVQSSNSEIESALNKALNVAAKQTFCPRIETEKLQDKLRIVQALDKGGWPYQAREITGKRAKYWLYIAAPKTPAIAEDIVKELATKSIDSFVINRAEMKNRISLGLFSSEDRANQARIRIQNDSGYPVDVYEHMRNVSIQQVDVRQGVSEEDWQTFLSQFDLSKMAIKVEKNAC
ncbi:SPOR domain-containing protein [Marinomonas algarum]|uniref:SPOR domain-containing protein n=1 Tax=Marinomonas algarum TaxID=2883105 RepID=A0A9X1IQI9_9GAMM|nr:SPOR domain-containing protein [Marinomonas algarum]MCB5162113.1 SPOR domain-containing protein [Marinomonas algarum]